MKKNLARAGIIAIGVLLILAAVVWWRSASGKQPEARFNGQRALADVNYQVDLGPRIPDSPAHQQLIDYVREQLTPSGWSVEVQETIWMGQTVRNIIAKRGSGSTWVVLGAHYDSRLVADQDPDISKRNTPVPGANDGASGVAVLLELGRTLPKDLDREVWLVFFDAEDNGDIAGWDWIMGSRAFVASLQAKPDVAVIIDMIGDANLNINQEKNSNLALSEAIWAVAAQNNYKQFLPGYKFAMLDDHTPFLEAGITAIDIIDFDYPYWHTTGDTTDKVSAESLHAVGDTLWLWLTASE